MIPPRRWPQSLHHAQTSAILDDASASPQGDWRVRPAFTGGAVGRERNLIILDAGDVLHDAFAVRGPRIDAESKPSPECGHLRPLFAPFFLVMQSTRPMSPNARAEWSTWEPANAVLSNGPEIDLS